MKQTKPIAREMKISSTDKLIEAKVSPWQSPRKKGWAIAPLLIRYPGVLEQFNG